MSVVIITGIVPMGRHLNQLVDIPFRMFSVLPRAQKLEDYGVVQKYGRSGELMPKITLMYFVGSNIRSCKTRRQMGATSSLPTCCR
jgi:hypothetical protein